MRAALSGRTLAGGNFDLDDYRGKVVVVNVSASWCTACEQEHPELEAAARLLAPEGVQFVGLNTQDTDAAARRFLSGMGGSSYPSVRDPDARKAADRVPERCLMDGRGYVRAKAVGAATGEWLITNAARLPAENTPAP